MSHPIPGAQRFLDALAAHDLESAGLADVAVSWHNLDEVEADLRTATASFATVQSVLSDFRYDEVHYSTADDGVSLARFVIKATLPDGFEMRAPGCLVVTERDGRIVRTEEYLDSAQLQPVTAAMQP